MLKVEHKDLEEITKFLDIIEKLGAAFIPGSVVNKKSKEAAKLSKMIKDKYTEIKPDYDRTN